MQGTGNDFAVIDAINQTVQITAAQISQLANRRFGIGFDQLLLIRESESPGIDFMFRIFNSDGSEAQQCGNGARCIALFLKEKGLSHKNPIMIETVSGILELDIDEQTNQVTVDMGEPVFNPARIPFIVDKEKPVYQVEVSGEPITMSVLSMGNPQAVITVQDADDAPLERLGPDLQRHESFPEQVNVGFMEVIDPGAVKLRVYERGTGETLSCGSGACAAVVSGRMRGILTDEVEVMYPGGTLIVRWKGPGSNILLTGTAGTVFDGEIKV
ncbi:MAG: diaminopimelate epimerase [bacterium]|nr:diaminopimelate epimerase [bacterium]